MLGNILGGIGLVGSIVGGIGALGISAEMSNSAMREAMLQKQIQEQNHKSMMLEARRKSTEMIRTQQRANAMALQSATNQGAAAGSGLQGGYGQIAGQTATNLAGVNQNLQIGEAIYGLNNQISNEKMLQASLGGRMNMYSGISSLGGSLMRSSGTIGNILSGWGGTSGGNSGGYDWIPRPMDWMSGRGANPYGY